jgi:Bacteriorhodopsin-like protein
VWLLEGNLASEVQWERYSDWVFTTPMLLAHLVSFGGLAADQWLLLMVSDVLMIGTGLAGEFATDGTKWAWLAFACLFATQLSLPRLRCQACWGLAWCMHVCGTGALPCTCAHSKGTCSGSRD